MASRVLTQTFAVVGAIIERAGKFILVKESRRKGPDGGKWNQPAGWLEVGEDPFEAVKREVLEETGYSFTPTHILGIYSLVRRDTERELGATPHPVKIIFLGRISGKPQPLHDDVSETRWFSPEEIYAMDHTTLRDIDIQKMVEDYLSKKRYSLELVTHTVSLTK